MSSWLLLPLSLAGLRIPLTAIGLSATLAVLVTVSLDPPTSEISVWIVYVPTPPLTPEVAYVCEPVTSKVPARRRARRSCLSSAACRRPSRSWPCSRRSWRRYWRRRTSATGPLKSGVPNCGIGKTVASSVLMAGWISAAVERGASATSASPLAIVVLPPLSSAVTVT